MALSKVENFNWELCCICQDSKNEALKCPLASNEQDHYEQSYGTFLANLCEFRNLDALPLEVKFTERQTVFNLVENRAKWHKSCHLKFSQSKLDRAKKKRKNETVEGEVPNVRSQPKRQSIDSYNCLFCQKRDNSDNLHRFSADNSDKNIRIMATELEDFDLLARMSGSDLMAIDAEYHLECLTEIRNKYRKQQRTERSKSICDDDNLNEASIEELMKHIQVEVDSGKHIFKLSELHSFYLNHLTSIGLDKQIQKTRLKNLILEHFSNASEEYADGKSILICFKTGTSNLLKDAVQKQDLDADRLMLQKAAKIIRTDIFEHEGFNFSGSFQPGCQENSVPQSLKLLMGMILNGYNLKEDTCLLSQSCLTISQLVYFNTKVKTSSSKQRHNNEREPPLPLYIAISIHAQTRSKQIIQLLHQMGVSVSYQRVKRIEEWLSTAVSERFNEDDIVCPSNLHKGIFTVGALDNLDHNPSSTTAKSSFHGTGISLFQFPTRSYKGESRPTVTVPPKGNKVVDLPIDYTVIQPASLQKSSLCVPESRMIPVETVITGYLAQENCWLLSCF